MKIGIDARMYSSAFTGIGRYVYELIHNLAEIDDRNEYVIFMNNPQFEEFKSPNKRFKKVLVNAPHYSFGEQWRFLRMLKKENLDLVHFTHFNAPIFYKKPCIVTIHDLTLHFYPGKKMTSFYRRWAYKGVLRSVVSRAKTIISVSKNTKQDLVKLMNVPEERIKVIYEGVNKDFKEVLDEDLIKDVRKKYGIVREFLLYTGVWRSHKNLVNLIKAFSYMKKDEDFDGQLVITGKEDSVYVEVRAMIDELELEGNVVFTGMVPEEELPVLYSAAKVYVFPSLYEGFGLPPLEAMSCGTPVAASKVSCIPEVVGEDNAVFFDPYDPSDISDGVLKVWENEILAGELREKGLERIKNFSWRKMARETLEVYGG
ncbi:MAG: glycosyltransferase family 1 protein [Patescibacteria group bacterium]|nr:glycosyltransferase family 4 protein [Patescibacteria group bacterium]